MIRRVPDAVGGPAVPHEVGTLARLTGITPSGDGMLHITAVGVQRHADHVGQHHPLGPVHEPLPHPVGQGERVHPGQQGEVAEHHEARDVVGPPVGLDVGEDQMVGGITSPIPQPIRSESGEWACAMGLVHAHDHDDARQRSECGDGVDGRFDRHEIRQNTCEHRAHGEAAVAPQPVHAH